MSKDSEKDQEEKDQKEKFEQSKCQKDLNRNIYLDTTIPLLRKEALYAKLHASIEQNNLIRLRCRMERAAIMGENKQAENDTSKKGQ